MRFLPLLIPFVVGCSGPESPKKATPTPTDTVPTETADTAPPPNPDCLTDATVRVGTGTDGFEPLPEGSELGFYLGPQGGHHVFVSLQAEGIYGGENALDQESPVVDLTMSSGGEEVAALLGQPRQMEATSDGETVELIGQALIFSVADATGFDQEPATLAWALRDRCEREFSGSVGVTLRYVVEQ